MKTNITEQTRNKTALVTGATSGLGLEMADYLHSLGWKLVLTGRNEKKLAELKKNFQCDTIALDLSIEENSYILHEFCKDKNISLLVNNAGFGMLGEFSELSLERELELIEVNVRTPHILTKLFLSDFLKNDYGYILNISSSGGFMSAPLFATYYASKAYVLRLSLGISEELKRRTKNVSISVFCPGPVDTDFNNRAGVHFSAKPADVKFCARYAVDKTLCRKPLIIPTFKMKAGVFFSKIIPEKIMLKIVYDIQYKKLH